MRILHYNLGLPPYRSGGLTKYSVDLMLEQKAGGEDVAILYPGDYTFWKQPKAHILKEKTFKGIPVYQIINPWPVPLLHGVRHPSDILNNKCVMSVEELDLFYDELKPEILHIHTFMGLPLRLLSFLKEKGVKVVLTTHDYFGLCLKVNFINQFNQLCMAPGGMQCAACNNNAPGSLFVRLRNSRYLLKYKEQFSSLKYKSVSSPKVEAVVAPTKKQADSYTYLFDYFKKYFDLVDCYHFNSNVAKEKYEQYVLPKRSMVLPISHSGILDARRVNKYDSKHLRLGFIGSTETYKGFPMLKEVLCQFNNAGIDNWSLNVWGGALGIDSDCNKIAYRGKYAPGNLATVFNEMDLLIVPSIWKETFSLITLEALSYGVPCLVSQNVGAKEIVKQYNPDFVYAPLEESLSAKLEMILSNSVLLADFNKRINAGKFEHSLKHHALEIKQLYFNLL